MATQPHRFTPQKTLHLSTTTVKNTQLAMNNSCNYRGFKETWRVQRETKDVLSNFCAQAECMLRQSENRRHCIGGLNVAYIRSKYHLYMCN